MQRILRDSILGCGLAMAVLIPVDNAYAASGEKVLYSFGTGANDGKNPNAALIEDKKGNFYGMTADGGTHGGGIVFELAPSGAETVLYNFCGQANCADGSAPAAALIMDKKGNLYGPTASGGADGEGAVFELAPDGTESVLYSLTGGGDGGSPWHGLLMNKKGDLYGTAVSGGSNNNGTVFEVAPNGTEKTLHTFLGGNDGSFPYGGLIADKKGNLYGTTVGGGSASSGIVFKVTPKGKESVLYGFCGQGNCADGGGPTTGLLIDRSGNLYGMTARGGAANEGVVFELAPDGTEIVLYSFCAKTGCADGASPNGGNLIMDKAGNLYGTTEYGGKYSNGTIFMLAPGGTETVLHSFGSGNDGANPSGGVIMDKKGNLYGTNFYGGASGDGAVFEFTK